MKVVVLEHVFEELTQYIPFTELQTPSAGVVPHLQSFEFSVAPLVAEHAGPDSHVLLEDVQYNPIDGVHFSVPQSQAAELGWLPSVLEHGVAKQILNPDLLRQQSANQSITSFADTAMLFGPEVSPEYVVDPTVSLSYVFSV